MYSKIFSVCIFKNHIFLKLNDPFEIREAKYLFSRHINDYHQIKCWRIVMNGATDGCSQMIRYLQCNNNNLAATVLHIFIGAISILCLLSWVRANFGVKNVDVAWFMLDCHGGGINRASFIAGTSIHNQCIVGLWGEAIRCVV